MFTDSELMKETASLSRFAHRLTRNPHDAEDLLQTTICTALEKKRMFEDGTNLFSWTSKIMFNAFVSGCRHKNRFSTQYDPQWYIEQEYIEAPQETEAELGLVNDAMTQLSDDHREILILVCVQGMQYAEVSEMLHIPVGTVRSRLSRARESLQSLIEAGRQQHVKQHLAPTAKIRLPVHAA